MNYLNQQGTFSNLSITNIGLSNTILHLTIFFWYNFTESFKNKSKKLIQLNGIKRKKEERLKEKAEIKKRIKGKKNTRI